jgi:hypothetical protein
MRCHLARLRARVRPAGQAIPHSFWQGPPVRGPRRTAAPGVCPGPTRCAPLPYGKSKSPLNATPIAATATIASSAMLAR